MECLIHPRCNANSLSALNKGCHYLFLKKNHAEFFKKKSRSGVYLGESGEEEWKYIVGEKKNLKELWKKVRNLYKAIGHSAEVKAAPPVPSTQLACSLHEATYIDILLRDYRTISYCTCMYLLCRHVNFALITI